MKDLRLIEIDQVTGVVTLSGGILDKTMTDLEAAIQRFVVCINNTQGTIIDEVGWGGSILRLWLSNRARTQNETKDQVAAIINNTISSLAKTEDLTKPYAITNAVLTDIKRESGQRGFSATVRIEFNDAVGTEIRIPGNTNVAI